MPSGIYKRSKMHNQHIGESLRGKKKSGEHVQHIKDARKRSEDLYSEASKKHSIFMTKHNPRKGKAQSEKQRLAIAEYNKHRVFSAEERENRRQNAIKHPCLKFKDTGIELKIEQELKHRGIFYKKQVPLLSVAIVDFYLPEENIVIQADGCFWHNCPIHNSKPLIGRTERDRQKDITLKENGLIVFRFWEHDINKSVEKCIDQLGL